MSRKYLSLDHLKKRSANRRKLFTHIENTDHSQTKGEPLSNPSLEATSTIGGLWGSPPVLPPYGSMKKYCTFVYDQGQLGSCTVNAFCGAYCILEQIKNGSVFFEP